MAQSATFQENGFAVFPGFYSASEIDLVQSQIAAKKKERPKHISVDLLDEPGGRRASLGSLDDDGIASRHYKINDLYLDMETVRYLALSERVAPLLKQMLGETPVLCNSLYMDKGTTQPPHVDSIYMTPQTHGHLIAIWVALEDAHEDAGQLEYFPGSHLLEQMKFSTGSYHFVPDEMETWKQYINAKVKEAGLEKQAFAAKKGDVFVWHANLLHAGGPISDWTRTRKSLVFHYWSEHDCKQLNYNMKPMNGAYWWDRPHPTIPGLSIEVEFSEEAYLDRYPDVAAAVKAGHLPSGRAHFDSHGKKEGRNPARV